MVMELLCAANELQDKAEAKRQENYRKRRLKYQHEQNAKRVKEGKEPKVYGVRITKAERQERQKQRKRKYDEKMRTLRAHFDCKALQFAVVALRRDAADGSCQRGRRDLPVQSSRDARRARGSAR